MRSFLSSACSSGSDHSTITAVIAGMGRTGIQSCGGEGWKKPPDSVGGVEKRDIVPFFCVFTHFCPGLLLLVVRQWGPLS